MYYPGVGNTRGFAVAYGIMHVLAAEPLCISYNDLSDYVFDAVGLSGFKSLVSGSSSA